MVPVAGAVVGVVYLIGRFVGLHWLLLTPGDRIELYLDTAPSAPASLRFVASSILLENRGMATATVDLAARVEFADGPPVIVPGLDCSAAGSPVSFPLAVRPYADPIALTCETAQRISSERLAQLRSGVRTVTIIVTTTTGRRHEIRHCINKDFDSAFWISFADSRRPARRGFSNTCED